MPLAALFALVFLGAQDVADEPVASQPPGEIRRYGDVYTCIMPRDRPRIEGGAAPCLILGGVRIGDTRAEAEAVFGTDYFQPSDFVDPPFIYVQFERDDGFLQTYVAVSYDMDERVSAIQLTGEPRVDWAFSSVRLGDTKEDVIAILGEAFSIDPVPEIGGTIWSYGSYPWSVEFVGGRVYSIRIEREGAELAL